VVGRGLSPEDCKTKAAEARALLATLKGQSGKHSCQSCIQAAIELQIRILRDLGDRGQV